MKKEDQVVSLEHAKEMEELGLKQDSLVSWIYYSHESLYGMSGEEIRRDVEFEWGLDCELCHNVEYIKKYAAPTVAELGEALKGEIIEGDATITKRNHYYLDCGKIESEHTYYVRYIRHDTGDTFCITHGNTEANARAKMWLHLRKKGLI